MRFFDKKTEKSGKLARFLIEYKCNTIIINLKTFSYGKERL